MILTVGIRARPADGNGTVIILPAPGWEIPLFQIYECACRQRHRSDRRASRHSRNKDLSDSWSTAISITSLSNRGELSSVKQVPVLPHWRTAETPHSWCPPISGWRHPQRWFVLLLFPAGRPETIDFYNAARTPAFRLKSAAPHSKIKMPSVVPTQILPSRSAVPGS